MHPIDHGFNLPRIIYLRCESPFINTSVDLVEVKLLRKRLIDLLKCHVNFHRNYTTYFMHNFAFSSID